MLTSTLLYTLLPIIAASTALASHNPPHLRHRKLAEKVREVVQPESRSPPVAIQGRSNEAHADAHRIIKRSVVKKGQQCRPRATAVNPQAMAVASQSASSSSVWVAPASTSSASETWSQGEGQQQAASPTSTWTEPSVSSSEWSEPTTATSDGGFSLTVSGLLSINDNRCGWCNSDDSQPNGSIDWLNCGVEGGGWTPPYVTMNQLIATKLDAHGVFAPCAEYIDRFNAYGQEFNIHPIMLASFAMQESTCRPEVTGGGGEAGLMQIAPPNCEDGHNCWDVDYNIRRGAQLFRKMIDDSGGNVLQAIGAYNGWPLGLTVGQATAAKSRGQCLSQNNLDYLYQYTNGWMQNKDANSMGRYFNLRGC